MKVYFSNNSKQYLYTRVSEYKSNLKAFHPHCTLSIIRSKYIMHLVYMFSISTECVMLLFMHNERQSLTELILICTVALEWWKPCFVVFYRDAQMLGARSPCHLVLYSGTQYLLVLSMELASFPYCGT